jgi:4-hydroxybenzoate polyprenyltransferase
MNEQPLRPSPAPPPLPPAGAGASLVLALRTFSDLVKFEHTIFALPFAFVGCLMAGDGHMPPNTAWWVLVAMVGARTAGMTLNRLVDRSIDARNPRTSDRAIPAGRVSVSTSWAIVTASLVALWTAAAHLDPLCLRLAPVAVGLLGLYSFLKRYTPLAHLGLGLVLACAPIGGWIAVSGQITLPALMLGLAVCLWVAGFDVLYACLDHDFDVREGLYSIPSRFGLSRALQVARALHLATVALLFVLGSTLALGTLYYVGVGVVALLLYHENHLVEPHDLSAMDQAFFTMNGWVSVSLLVFTWLDILARHGGAERLLHLL